jgi:FtsZ-interacting cell division protein YlmF
MASTWQKMMFFLGLVDEDQAPDQEEDQHVRQSQVRTVEQSPERPSRQAASQQPAVRPLGPEGAGTMPPERGGVVAGRRVEPPAAQRRRISSDRSHAEAGVLVRETGSGFDESIFSEPAPMMPETDVIVARTFSDAQRLADNLRANTAVVLDLRSTEPEMVRRLVDFSSGLTYALDGSMRKVAQGVILVSPPRYHLSEDEKARLADMGLYAAEAG